MAYNYIDTPRTEVGNATYLTNGHRSTTRHNLSALDSVENSFLSPSADRNLLKTAERQRSRKSGDFALRTPRAGAAPRSSKNGLQSRRNLPSTAPPKGEFTPLMKSVTKNNFLRNAGRGGPDIPPYLQEDYRDPNTPGLPRIDGSEIYEDGSMHSIHDDDATPVPQVASSSPLSSPLPGFSGRNGHGGVIGDENMMTLKEQENAINRLEKDNWNLKLKIHFLEEKLEKANPNLNQTALKENIDLKISGKTMERELHRCKKNLIRAERKAEACQRELEEFHERWKEKQVDGTLQKELGWMKDEIESKDLEIKQLHDELTSAKEKESSELQDLREQITDLEYNLREKERILDQKDEEIEDLKDKEQEEHSSVAELEAQLERAKNQINDLKDSIECLKSDSQQTEAANQQAIEERNRAVEDLRELQDEMANKSFYTKGLNRQLEEKASALEDEVSTLRQQMDSLQEELESQKRSERQLERQFDDLRREHASEKTRFQDEIDSIRHERDLAKRELDSVSSLLHEAEDELGAKGDAKSLLQMRHDALTNESQCLQKDLERARTTIHELEQQVADEKQRSFESMEELKSHYKDEIDHLHDDIESLQRRIEDSESRFDVDRDKWESARRTLELQRHQAEQQGSGYKRTIERLQQTENSLSGKEKKFQDILDSEKLQRTEEKELLNRQINELNEDVAFRRQTIENQRAELFSLKEDLRAATREAEAMRERIQNLEDDKVVLQAELEQEQQLGQNQRKNGVSELEKLLQSSTRDRQFLRGRLADMEVELKELRATIPDIEADRDELKSQLNRIHSQVDETYRLDQEKLDLRKAKLRLEGELKRLKEEKEALLESKNALRIELDAEIKKSAAEENRLSSEIDRLQDRLLITSEKRDRELASAKGKAERFEKRARDLESVIEQQKPDELDAVPVTSDSSILRQHLDEARKKERSALQRESDLRSSVRQLKTRINELEAENHDLQTQKIDSMAVDGGLSPSSRFQEELRKLRSQVLEAHKKMKELRAKNNELQRYAMMAEERKDLHELLKSSTLEAESLSVKLAERDARVIELRNHLRRVREERSLSKKDAETANRQLQILQDKYDIALDDMAMRAEKKGRHEKELKGLSKEIMWLRARLSREQKFRKDLAWSKGIMELGERVRVACNEMDLRMIADMGVEPGMAEPRLSARSRFRSAAFVVIAAARMQSMASEWKQAQKLGEGLRKAKSEVLKRRETARKSSASSMRVD